MSIETIAGITSELDLSILGRSTGWTLDGLTGTHESCNDGSITAIGIDLIDGVEYIVSFNVASISGGLLNVQIGDTISSNITTSGYKEISLVASGDLQLRFYSNANCIIELLAVQNNEIIVSQTQDTTLAFSQDLNKWTSFYNFSPDTGCSLFTNLYTFQNGITYLHNPFNPQRGVIYGVQYYPRFKAVFNEGPTVQKMFQSINMNSGTLMVTSTDGIETSIGQLSQLDAIDFLQYTLDDGITTVNVYDKDGIYLARFLKATNGGSDINTGDLLKGNYVTVDLIATNANDLKLIAVSVKSVPSVINVR
jgi:hypothetical protein